MNSINLFYDNFALITIPNLLTSTGRPVISALQVGGLYDSY